jgi:cobalt-precorrin 5A hydrolase
MSDSDIAVVAITRLGVETSQKIQRCLEAAGLAATVYAPKKYSQSGVVVMEKNIGDFIKDIYSKVDAVVAVMATGIIIRSVAPLLESKLTDPAVVGVDASGKFVISLLSGHLGGANQLSRLIAEGIGATPVITTASDVMGKQSVDELAKQLHLAIRNPDSLVAVNSAIVNEDRIVVVLVGEVKLPISTLGGFEVKTADNGLEALDIINRYDAGIIVTNEPLAIAKFVKPFTILKIKRIVVGLGARRDASAENILKAVNQVIDKLHLPLARIDRYATVDIKRSSKPMIEAVEKLGAPLEFLTVEELRGVVNEDLSPDSAMVQEKIGVGGVCERAALLVAGNNSKLILKKTKLNGVTVAVAEGE